MHPGELDYSVQYSVWFTLYSCRDCHQRATFGNGNYSDITRSTSLVSPRTPYKLQGLQLLIVCREQGASIISPYSSKLKAYIPDSIPVPMMLRGTELEQFVPGQNRTKEKKREEEKRKV